MKKLTAVAILSALAQDNRLDIFRLLVEAGPHGMPAGHISASLKLPPNALSFHLDRLRAAGLLDVRRDGRSMIYSAKITVMNALVSYLTDHCCQGKPELCCPAAKKSERSRKAVQAL